MSLFEPIDSRAGDGALPPPLSPSVRRAAMLEHPTIAVAAFEKGRVRETNAAWRTLFASPPGVAVESHVATLFANAGAADRFERTLQAALRDPSGRASTADRVATSSACEQVLARRDGSTFVAEVVVTLADRGDIDRPLSADAVWQVRDISVERALRRELRELEDYHRELSRYQSDLTFVIDRKGRIAYVSASVERALGFPVNALLGEPFASLLEPTHAVAAEHGLRAACGARSSGASSGPTFDLHVVHADGSTHLFTCRPRDCFDVPRVAGMVLHLCDGPASPIAEASSAAQAASGRLRAAWLRLAGLRTDAAGSAVGLPLLQALSHELAATTVTLWRVEDADDEAPNDASWRVEAVAARDTADADRIAPRLTDAPASPVAAIADASVAAIGPDLAAGFAAAGITAVAEAPVFHGGRCIGRLAVAHADPHDWLDAELDFVLAAGSLVASAAFAQDRRNASSAPAPAFTRDTLTSLPDRLAAIERLDALVASADVPWSVLVVDLMRLSDVNDRHGYAAGDAVVVRAAAIVAAEAGSEAFVARIDGSTLLVATSGDPRDGERLADALVQRIGDVASLESHEVAIEANIGIAHVAPRTAPAQAPLLQAELALREARGRGTGRVAVFQPRLVVALETRKALDEEIEDAIAHDEFEIVYQPQFALASGRVVGFEALVRWQHPTRGLLSPNAFMDVAFERGLIDAITKTVLAQVCGQIATWRRTGEVAELPVAVNVSGRQFHDRRLPALVASALLKSGLPARLLLLEITEQTLVGDDVEVERVVRELSRLGVRIAIGDFNVGHASFRYLRQLKVSQVKLDKGFVRQLPDDPESVIVVGAVVELARRLKYQVVAEGVETREQLEHLRSIGCEAGQGFHLGAPLPASEVAGFLEAHARRSAV